jgi:hypothetical protein
MGRKNGIIFFVQKPDFQSDPNGSKGKNQFQKKPNKKNKINLTQNFPIFYSLNLKMEKKIKLEEPFPGTFDNPLNSNSDLTPNQVPNINQDLNRNPNPVKDDLHPLLKFIRDKWCSLKYQNFLSDPQASFFYILESMASSDISSVSSILLELIQIYVSLPLNESISNNIAATRHGKRYILIKNPYLYIKSLGKKLMELKHLLNSNKTVEVFNSEVDKPSLFSRPCDWQIKHINLIYFKNLRANGEICPSNISHETMFRQCVVHETPFEMEIASIGFTITNVPIVAWLYILFDENRRDDNFKKAVSLVCNHHTFRPEIFSYKSPNILGFILLSSRFKDADSAVKDISPLLECKKIIANLNNYKPADKKDDIFYRIERGLRPLYLKKVVKALVSAGVNVKGRTFPVLHIFATRINILRFLESSGTPPDYSETEGGKTMFESVVFSEKRLSEMNVSDFVYLLEKQNFSVSYSNKTCKFDIVRGNPNIRCQETGKNLLMAILSQREDLKTKNKSSGTKRTFPKLRMAFIKYFGKLGKLGEVDKAGKTAIFYCNFDKVISEEMLAILSDSKVDPYHKDLSGKTFADYIFMKNYDLSLLSMEKIRENCTFLNPEDPSCSKNLAEITFKTNSGKVLQIAKKNGVDFFKKSLMSTKENKEIWSNFFEYLLWVETKKNLIDLANEHWNFGRGFCFDLMCENRERIDLDAKFSINGVPTSFGGIFILLFALKMCGKKVLDYQINKEMVEQVLVDEPGTITELPNPGLDFELIGKIKSHKDLISLGEGPNFLDCFLKTITPEEVYRKNYLREILSAPVEWIHPGFVGFKGKMLEICINSITPSIEDISTRTNSGNNIDHEPFNLFEFCFHYVYMTERSNNFLFFARRFIEHENGIYFATGDKDALKSYYSFRTLTLGRLFDKDSLVFSVPMDIWKLLLAEGELWFYLPDKVIVSDSRLKEKENIRKEVQWIY